MNEYQAKRQAAEEYNDPRAVAERGRQHKAATEREVASLEIGIPTYGSMQELVEQKDITGMVRFRSEDTKLPNVSTAIGIDDRGREWILGRIASNLSEAELGEGSLGAEPGENAGGSTPDFLKEPTQEMVPADVSGMTVEQISELARQRTDAIESRPKAEPGFLAELETTLNAPFAGLSRGLYEFGGNTLAGLGVLDQQEVDDFFNAMDAISAAATEDMPAAAALDTVGSIGGQYVAPAVGMYQKLRGLGMGAIGASILSEGGTGLLGVSPNEENLFNMIPDDAEHPAAIAARELLGTDPDDPDYVNRARNFADALIALGAGEAAVRGLMAGVRKSQELARDPTLQKILDEIDAADQRLKDKSKGGDLMSGVDPTDALGLLKPVADALRAPRLDDLVGSLRMTPAEKKYLEDLLGNEVNRAELMEAVPSLKVDGNMLSVDEGDWTAFQTFNDEGVALDGARSVPKRFRDGSAFDRMSVEPRPAALAAVGAATAVGATVATDDEQEAVAGIVGKIDDLLNANKRTMDQQMPQSSLDRLRDAIDRTGTVDPDTLAEFNYNQWEDPTQIDTFYEELVDLGRDKLMAYRRGPGAEARKSMERSLDELTAAQQRLDRARAEGGVTAQQYQDMTADITAKRSDLGTRLDESARKEARNPGATTREDREWLASRLNMDDIQALDNSRPMNDVEITATKVMLQGLMRRMRKLHQEAVKAPTEENIVELRRHAMVTAGVMLKFKNAAREAGRALNAFRGTAKTPLAREQETNMLYKLADQGRTNESFVQAMGDLLAEPDDSKVFDFIMKQRSVGSLDMLYEAWINSLLGSPTTHAVNIASNALLNTLMIGDRFAAAGVGTVRRAMGGKGGVTLSEANRYALATFPALLEAAQVAGRTLTSGSSSDVMQKIAPEFQPAITADNVNEIARSWGMSPELLRQGGVMARGVDILGEYYYRMPSRLLQTEDDFFKTILYRRELHARALDKVQNTPGLTDQEAKDLYREIIADPEIHAPDVHIAAVEDARYGTLTTPPGRVGQAVSKVRTELPALRLIMPFLNVINNIVTVGFDHVPVPSYATGKRAIAGDIRGREADELLGRYVMGATVMAMAGLGAMGEGPMAERVTGRMTDNPDMLRTLERQGRQPWSVKVGDEYVSIERLAPVAIPWVIGAEIGQAMAYAQDPAEREMLALAGLQTIMPFLFEQSVMTGIKDFMEAIDPPLRNDGTAAEYTLNFVADLASTATGAVAGPLAPGTPLQGLIARQIDNRRKNTKADKVVPDATGRAWEEAGVWARVLDRTINRIYSRTAGMGGDVPAMHNVWGEPTHYGAWGPDAISPFWSMTSQIDFDRLRGIEGIPDRAKNPGGSFFDMRVGEEMTRRGYQKWLQVVGIDGEAERLALPISPPSDTVNGQQLTVEMHESLKVLAGKGVRISGDMYTMEATDITGRRLNVDYKRPSRRVRNLLINLGIDPSKMYGQKEMLDAVVRSPFYGSFDDGTETEGGEGIDTKVEIITAIHNWYNGLARDAVRVQYPELGRRILRMQNEARRKTEGMLQ